MYFILSHLSWLDVWGIFINFKRIWWYCKHLGNHWRKDCFILKLMSCVNGELYKSDYLSLKTVSLEKLWNSVVFVVKL